MSVRFLEDLNVDGDLSVTGTIDGVDIGANHANWNTAYGWGDHASVGYVKTDTNTVPLGVTASNTTTTTDLNMRNYKYRATTHTPTRGSYGYHLFHNWTDNLVLTLTHSSWQRGDVVEIASTRGDRNVTINATRIYLPNGSYDTQVTYNNKSGCFKIIKYSSTTGYWMVAMDG